MNFKKENLKAELNFLKELFDRDLPVGEKKDHIKDYFSRLEELIYTNDYEHLQREEFPPDDPTAGGPREYKYYSADQFKKFASGHQQPPRGQDLGYSESKQEKLSATEDRGTESEDVAHLQECPSTNRVDSSGRDGYSDNSGKLDRGDVSELSDFCSRR